VINILSISTDPDGRGCRVRLGCDCGNPQIVCCTDEDERIIFCKPCGTMTTEDQLRSATSDGTNAGIPWSFENVGSSRELPLLNVSIPCTISCKMGPTTKPAPSGCRGC